MVRLLTVLGLLLTGACARAGEDAATDPPGSTDGSALTAEDEASASQALDAVALSTGTNSAGAAQDMDAGTGPDQAVLAEGLETAEASAPATGSVPLEGCSVMTCNGGSAFASGARCDQVISVGRLDALAATHLSAQNTLGKGNDHDKVGQGPDQFFQIYLFQDETLTAQLEITGAPFDAILLAFPGSACASPPDGSGWRADDGSAGENETLSLSADIEGWYSLVVDGTGSQDGGPYALRLRIEGNQADCEC